jgi:hypothetical protein
VDMNVHPTVQGPMDIDVHRSINHHTRAAKRNPPCTVKNCARGGGFTGLPVLAAFDQVFDYFGLGQCGCVAEV